MGEHFKENSEEKSVLKAGGGDGSSLTSCRRKNGGRKACIPLCSHIPSVCSDNRPHPLRNEQQKVPIWRVMKAGRERE